MDNQIYIPKRIKAGYNKRNDTYSKKLAYVIYYDDKGVLRKEGSWKNWIEKEMGIDDFDNIPMEGFVLNRNVGGAKQSYGWDTRIEKVRVYDPRGFEIEIDLPNVLFILQECTSSKGKGLEGEFVYGWNGKNLVLIPTSCDEYKQSQIFTSLQTGKISTKELIVGASYKTKKLKDLIYLGRFDWVEKNYNKNAWLPTKKYIFVDENAQMDDYIDDREDYDSDEEYQEQLEETAKLRAEAIEKGENYQFLPFASVSNLAACNSETPVANYADLMTRFNKTKNSGIPVGLVEKPAIPKPKLKKDRYENWENTDTKTYYIKKKEGVYVSVNIEAEYRNDNKEVSKFTIDKNNEISFDDKTKAIKSDWIRTSSEREKKYTTEQIKELGLVDLYVKLNNNELVVASEYE